ncbi:MAG: hypothetical protein Q7S56_00815 [Nanoarchaeota archaeon]|nr:hypothetical protein [Nanoarchaeota archaeon]
MRNLTKIILLSAALATGAVVLISNLRKDKIEKYDHFRTDLTQVIKKDNSSIHFYKGPQSDFIVKDKYIYNQFKEGDAAFVTSNEPYTIDKDRNIIYLGREFVSAKKKES